MTQEVQPLTWSKRTNIEEHQQFFSKINEIIGNLASTVDEAEQAIAQATAAIASANDAVATANAASAAASAAASQAQTAASTVAGYDGRLTAAEGGIDSLQAADANNVKITGIHNIGNYAVLLTGNQDPIAGVKTFANNISQKNTSWETAPRILQIVNIDSLAIPDTYRAIGGGIEIRDMNGRTMWSINCYRDTNGRDVLSFEGEASDGTTSGYLHFALAPNGYRKIDTNFEKPSTW